MSNIFKVAYARGVQHALVASQAIHKYASEEAADAAAAAAAEEIPEDLPIEEEAVPLSTTGDVAAKLVELSQAAGETAAAAAEQSNIAQEAALAVQALQQGGAPQPAAPSPAPEELGAAAAQLEQKAAALRVMQKRAAAMRKHAVGMDAVSAVPVGALEGVTTDGRDPYYANSPPAVNYSGFSVEEAPHPDAQTLANAFKQGSVNLDAKTAAAILRKLAVGMDAASPVPVGDEPGVSDDARAAGFANNAPSTDISGASVVEAPHPGAVTGANAFKTGSAQSAFDLLFKKTASEVGNYLPQHIPNEAKVAAVRTMIGMNGDERTSYLQRLHKAAADAAAEEDAGKDSSGKCKKCGEKSCDGKNCMNEEKSASAILRRLGLGQ